MIRSVPRAPRQPKAAREAAHAPALVFRDFVRQLERLDAGRRKTSRKGAR